MSFAATDVYIQKFICCLFLKAFKIFFFPMSLSSIIFCLSLPFLNLSARNLNLFDKCIKTQCYLTDLIFLSKLILISVIYSLTFLSTSCLIVKNRLYLYLFKSSSDISCCRYNCYSNLLSTNSLTFEGAGFVVIMFLSWKKSFSDLLRLKVSLRGDFDLDVRLGLEFFLPFLALKIC